MNKILGLLLILSAAQMTACGISLGCDEMGCQDSVEIKLSAVGGGSLGEVSGTVTVNGETYQIEDISGENRGCRSGSACVEGAVLTLSYFNSSVVSGTVVSVDLSADNGTRQRRATMSVDVRKVPVYPNGEDCPAACDKLTGSVTLQ